MDNELVSPLSLRHPFDLQQINSIDKEVACIGGLECLECEHDHVYKQCENCWNTIRPRSTPPPKIVQKPTWRQKHLPKKITFRWYHWLVLGLAMATVVVLAVVFRPKKPSGVYRNGTGLVALDRGDDSTAVDIFFQHASGQIRHLVLDGATAQWSEGLPADAVLAQNAPQPRRGTPLMGVSYTIDGETTWRIFYIDTNNYLQESIGSTITNEFPTQWVPGPLGLGPLGLGPYKAYTGSHTGISACKHMMWSTDAGGFQNGSLVLLYGGEDGKNHMLIHDIQNNLWKNNHTFEDSSASSGIECTVRGSEILDTWMINSKGQLIQASFNFNPLSKEPVYPAGQWTNGVIYDKLIATPTSISAIKYTGNTTVYESNSTFVYFSTPGGIVSEINVDTYNRTHPPIVTQESSNVNTLPILDQSRIACVSLRTDPRHLEAQNNGQESKIFLQYENNPSQISVMTRNFWEGWRSAAQGDGEVSSIGF